MNTMQAMNVLLYYKYVEIENPEELRDSQRELCIRLGLTGRILIGKEGINGTVAGQFDKIEEYKQVLRSDSRFSDIEFKESDSEGDPFGSLTVKARKEIVTLGTEADPKTSGKHLSPKEFREMIDRDDVVILDARNDYEHQIGKFKNAITLPIENFRDFKDAVQQIMHLKDKKILTYCTGGIRCEKASSLLVKEGFKDVYQLHGGIVTFGKELPDDESWEGSCFVFDNRFKVTVGNKKNLISHCMNCDIKSDDVRNCCNAKCNKLIIQCDSCCEKTSGGCSPECTALDRKKLSSKIAPL